MSEFFSPIKLTEEFNIGNEDAMSFSVRYPICVIAYSTTHIIVYDLKNYTTLNIRRPGENDGIVLCSSISEDRNFVATGHSNGEIFVWSISTKSVTYNWRVKDSVACIAFLDNNTVIHSDLSGGIYQNQFYTKFFKKQITTNQVIALNRPLSCLAVNNKCIYASTSNTTTAYMLSPSFRMLWSDTKASLGINFSNSNVIRIVGKTVEVVTQYGDVIKTLSFDEVPTTVAVVDEKAMLVLKGEKCELVLGDKRFLRDVPAGLPATYDDKIFIAGNGKINVISIATIQERVDLFIKEGMWNEAFNQIENVNDVNVQELFVKFSKEACFDPKQMFSAAERLNCRNLITCLPFGDKNEEIIKSIVMYTHQWPLSKELIQGVLDSKSISNEDKTVFMINSPLMLCYAEQIVLGSLHDNPYLSFKYCISFLGDVKMALEIAYSNKMYEQVYEALEMALTTQPENERLVMDGIYFISQNRMNELLSYNEERFEKLMEKAFSYRKNPYQLFSTVIQVIKPTSRLWDLICNLIGEQILIITENELPYIFDFIIHSEHQSRESILTILIQEKTTDYNALLQCARDADLHNSEYRIIELLGDSTELIFSLVKNQESSFSTHLHMTVKEDIKRVLLFHCRIFVRINPQEFANEMVETGDPMFIKKVSKTLSTDQDIHWHFLKNLFMDNWYAEHADEETSFQYIKYLSVYKPETVYDEIVRINSVPYDKVLPIILENGIYNASLYTCSMIGDMERALSIAKNGLLDALMVLDKDTVEETTKFIGSLQKKESERMWMECFTCFQLPFYAFKGDKEKLSKIIELFSVFLKPMLIVIDPSDVSDKFSSLFSFIPFSVARPILIAFFSAIRERNEFYGTLSNIKKDEALNAQMNYGRNLMKGKIIDARRCAKCHKTLGANDAYAAKCGHIFHIDCATDGWCPVCRRSFEKPNIKTTICPAKMVQAFDSLDIIDNNKETIKAKPKVLRPTRHSEIEMPSIGVIVPEENA